MPTKVKKADLVARYVGSLVPEQVDVRIYINLDPNSSGAQGRGNNLARKCLVGMPCFKVCFRSLNRLVNF